MRRDFVDLWALRPGELVRTVDGEVADVTKETEDGLRVGVRYPAYPSVLEPEDYLLHRDEILSYVDEEQDVDEEDELRASVELRRLIDAASDMFRGAATDEPPPALVEDEPVPRQLLQLLAEQSDAILVLCQHSLYRPAYATLRSILETMAKLLWVSLDPPRYGELFLKGTEPNMREILRRIGWEEEYERTFQDLSDFVHSKPRASASDFYLTYDWGADGPLPDFGPDTAYFVVEGLEGVSFLASNPMTRKEALVLYEPYLAAKVFDIALLGLRALYGNSCERRGWWPHDALPVFVGLCARRPDLAESMRWMSAS